MKNQNFNFKPKLSLLQENQKENDNEDEFPDFDKFILYMIFVVFHKNSDIPDNDNSENGYFHQKFEKS